MHRLVVRLSGTIGLGDIGFKTVHIIKMVNGAYKDSYSGTMERLGMSNAFLNFYKRVSQQRGLKPNEAELEFKQGKNLSIALLKITASTLYVVEAVLCVNI